MRGKIVYILIALCCVFVQSSYGKKSKTLTVEGSSQVISNENMSIKELQEKAILEAQKNAIENTFGKRISSSEALIINENTSVASQSTSQTKAEWVSDIECKISDPIQIEPGKYVIECYIKGIARQIGSEQVDFEAEILKNAPNRKFVSLDGNFNDGDELFVYFKSPVSGYLNIYLLDEENAFLLLPYREASDGAYYIEADKDYIFFSPKLEKNNPQIVDEYVLNVNSGMSVEINTIDFYFSPSKFNKGRMNVDNKNLTRPKDMKIENYVKWKTNLLTSSDEVTNKSFDIKIYNNEN